MDLRIILFLIGLIAMAGCSGTAGTAPSSSAAAPTGRSETSNAQLVAPRKAHQPFMHAVHNQTLQQLMHQMNSLVYEKMPSPGALAAEKQRRTLELAETAGKLSGTVESIIGTLPSLDLDEVEKASFLTLAKHMKILAGQLRDQAQTDRLEAVPETMADLRMTCTSCHSLFRKSRNIMDRCRDPKSTC